MYRIKAYMFILVAGILFIFPAWSVIQAASSMNEDAICQFYTETGDGKGGYAVSDEDGVSFGSTFQKMGLNKVGYPISQRYERDGFVTQAFQKSIMQWQAESGRVVLVNIFDDLHNTGHDDRLLTTRQTPAQLPVGWDGDLSFDDVVKKRQALLDKRPALRAAYFAVSDPLTFYGLPTSEIVDMDSHYAIRLQRTVLQEWKEEVPWAKVGEVTIANGGDIAKELGELPAKALLPLAQSPCAVTTTGVTSQSATEATSKPTAEVINTPVPPTSEPAAPAPVVNTPVPSPTASAVPTQAPVPTAISETSAATTTFPSADACTPDMALVELSHGLREEVTISLESGPQTSIMVVPSREIKKYCLTPGTYDFRAFAFVSGQERGTQTFTAGECQCWRLYWYLPGRSCTCSNTLSEYKLLPDLGAASFASQIR